MKGLPEWRYQGQRPADKPALPNESIFSLPALEGPLSLDLGNYVPDMIISNCTDAARPYFNLGLRSWFSFQHEMAASCFLAATKQAPYCALAHGLVALCHGANYNFNGKSYYDSTYRVEEEHQKNDLLCIFPSQVIADRHSQAGVDVVEEIKNFYRNSPLLIHQRHSPDNNKTLHLNIKDAAKDEAKDEVDQSTSTSMFLLNDNPPLPDLISDLECQWLAAIRLLTFCPGITPDQSDQAVGRPYAAAMRQLYRDYPHNPEVIFCFADSVMVLQAWRLYEYPTGKPVSDEVEEIQSILERGLAEHPTHAGLCHLYVHLSEMSAHPERALPACKSLRYLFPHAGHLVHMGTHIDVLLGDYPSCVHYNELAMEADAYIMKCSPAFSNSESFYFGYVVHNWHMAVYACVLGGYEGKGMDLATTFNNQLVNEEMLSQCERLASYLESYSALDVHVMVRFGRWKHILVLKFPRNTRLMLFRTASLHFARGLAFAALGDVDNAKWERDNLNCIRNDPEIHSRILYNNSVNDLLEIDAVMLQGEILYRERRYVEAFASLRRAVDLQDNLVYDEPWGKMQPVRHSLGGLLLEQGYVVEAEGVFRKDLKLHPKNPFALVGLMSCLRALLAGVVSAECSCGSDIDKAPRYLADELCLLEQELQLNQCDWSDFDVTVACECCKRPK